jgi:hypothetical protein
MYSTRGALVHLALVYLMSLVIWVGCTGSVGAGPAPGQGDAGPDSPGAGGSGGRGASGGAGGPLVGTGGIGGKTGTIGGTIAGTGGVGAGSGGVSGGVGGSNGGTGGLAGRGGIVTGTGGGFAGTGGAAGSAADPCATALFCDDFEGYAAGPAPGGSWTSQLNGGTVAVDTTQFRSGAKSVKFTTPARAGGKTAFLRLASPSVFPVTGNVFYGRMMFRLESAPTTSVHWTFIEAGGTVVGQTYHALYRYGGQLPVMQGAAFIGSQFIANYDTPDWYSGTGPGSDCWRHANRTVVPVGTWSCVEWRFDGPNNDMRMWLDDVALNDLTVTGAGQGCVNAPANYTWAAPTFDHLELGWDSSQTDTARTIWIDDVVVSRTQIGCPR